MDALKIIQKDHESREKLAEKMFGSEAGEFKEMMLKQFWNNQFLYVEARYKFQGKKVVINGWDLYEECELENEIGIIKDANYFDSENRENIYFTVYLENLNEHVNVKDFVMELFD